GCARRPRRPSIDTPARRLRRGLSRLRRSRRGAVDVLVRLGFETEHPRGKDDAATVRVDIDGRTTRRPVRVWRGVACRTRSLEWRARCRGGLGTREVEHQLVERVDVTGGLLRPHNLHLHLDRRETEDGAVFPEAVGELRDDRQPDDIPVERDRGVIVGARVRESHGAGCEVMRPLSRQLAFIVHGSSLHARERRTLDRTDVRATCFPGSLSPPPVERTWLPLAPFSEPCRRRVPRFWRYRGRFSGGPCELLAAS